MSSSAQPPNPCRRSGARTTSGADARASASCAWRRVSRWSSCPAATSSAAPAVPSRCSRAPRAAQTSCSGCERSSTNESGRLDGREERTHASQMRSQKLGTEGESLCAMQLYLSRPWQMAGYLPCGILYFHDIGQFRSVQEKTHMCYGENHTRLLTRKPGMPQCLSSSLRPGTLWRVAALPYGSLGLAALWL